MADCGKALHPHVIGPRMDRRGRFVGGGLIGIQAVLQQEFQVMRQAANQQIPAQANELVQLKKELEAMRVAANQQIPAQASELECLRRDLEQMKLAAPIGRIEHDQDVVP